MIRQASVVVVGAGHAGLAVSRRLTDRQVDHVVLERGRVAHSWRTQRWDSLRLLTPNWMTRLPGGAYAGGDPDGFMAAADLADLIDDYAVGLPVLTDTPVVSVRDDAGTFAVDTEAGTWRARAVVIATGATVAAPPPVPLPAGLASMPALDYRRPADLPDGGVLVVGGGASGVQIADELNAAGRPVWLSTAEHVRVPRTYRGRDILWWLDHLGVLDQRWDEVDDIVRVRNLPSFQLIGAPRTIDFAALQRRGVRIAGKLAAVRDAQVLFSGGLANVLALADLKLARLLRTIDAVVGGPGEPPEPTAVPDAPLTLDLTSGEVRSVVWATGIRADHAFVDLPVLDARGAIRHDGGVTPWPGLYVVGLPVLRTRRSGFIDGAVSDSAAVVDGVCRHLGVLTHA